MHMHIKTRARRESPNFLFQNVDRTALAGAAIALHLVHAEG